MLATISTSDGQPAPSIKTALVLSGGGMFGAYQAGAWRALSRVAAPEIVVGTSVGALNGWCIAAGAPPEELERYWLDPSTGKLMTYRDPRLRWCSVFDPRPLEARVRDLVERYQPRVDYGVVLLELKGLRPRLFRNSEITWRHLVASCALPGGFPPVRINGRLYCDGGVLESTPVWAAFEMGATRAIAVNASRFSPPPGIGMLLRGMRCIGKRSAGGEVVTITPKDFLGKFLDGAHWNEENIRRWIALGEADARAAI